MFLANDFRWCLIFSAAPCTLTYTIFLHQRVNVKLKFTTLQKKKGSCVLFNFYICFTGNGKQKFLSLMETNTLPRLHLLFNFFCENNFNPSNFPTFSQDFLGVWHLRLSHQCCRRFKSSGMLQHVNYTKGCLTLKMKALWSFKMLVTI